MSEQTNQNTEVMDFAADADTNVTELPESLFEDTETEPETRAESNVTEDGAEGEATLSEQQDNTPAGDNEATPQQMLKIKFNGVEREISMEEAVTLAQKGMNYDHVVAERDNLKQNRAYIERFAKDSGMSVEQYMAALESNSQQSAQQSEIQNIEEQYPDLPDDAMTELARLRIEKRNRELAQAEAEENQRAMDARTKPWRDFIKAFPDVSVKDLPDTVIQEIESGKTPIEAYQSHLITELTKTARIAEQKGMNKARAVGSAKGDADEKQKDSFLDGFLSD